MVLVNPTIVGPISELTTPFGLRLRGQIPGCDISIFTTTPSLSLIAEGRATASDQRFALLSGIELRSDMSLYAMQKGGGDSSKEPTGDHFMKVQARPADPGQLNAIAFEATVFECGLFLWATGGVPGAEVQVSAGGTLLGSGPLLEGEARIQLETGIPPGSVVAITQVVPGLPPGSGVNQSATSIPLPRGAPLPPPTVQLPLRGCDSFLQVAGVFEGALVSVTRGSGAVETAGFGRSSARLILQAPLERSEPIMLAQSVYEKCERPSSHTDPPIIVGEPTPVDAPEITPPLCNGSCFVKLTGLRGNSLVRMKNESQSFVGTTPADATECVFEVAGLLPGTISATQELCGIVSASSKSVNVDRHSESVPATEMIGTLFECARNVTIRKVYPGAMIQVFSVDSDSRQSPISDQMYAESTSVVIPVSPRLQHEWKGVQAAQWACSDSAVWSGIEPVFTLSDLPRPAISGAIYTGDTDVEVDGTTAGAHVELFVTNSAGVTSFAGSVDASYILPTSIHSNIPLNDGDFMFARQSLCQSEQGGSKTSETVPVQPAFQPRPFYVIGHNPNTIGDVNNALAAGANALEPDVNIYHEANGNPVLVVSHNALIFPLPPPITLVDFLKELHVIAARNPSLALVTFDCKPDTNSADYGFEILMAIRQHLTSGLAQPLPIIMSVAKLSGVAMFDQIKPILGPLEGLMVDEEDDPGSVATFFTNAGVAHRCYGNGSILQPLPPPSPLVPHLRPSIEWACGIRAGFNSFKFIYEYTTNNEVVMNEFIITGVDGIITDEPADLRAVATNPRFASSIRLAARSDNPFKQPNSLYVITTVTGDVGGAGTDATLTFTINGTRGSVSRNVDTFLQGRMERGDTNYVTLHSPDLGDVASVTVQSDGRGNGPPWFLQRIRVDSARYGVHKSREFAGWIGDTSPHTIALT